jgi:hypothetical protein
MRTLSDLTSIYLYQTFIKAAINAAISVKLLTSKVTLLNTCGKLKMTHGKQLDLGNIKSKSMRLVIVKHVTLRLKCGSGCETERVHGADAERIWGQNASF